MGSTTATQTDSVVTFERLESVPMQPVPVRLAQTIRLAFRSSRPPPSGHTKFLSGLAAPERALPQPCLQGRFPLQVRFYSVEQGTGEDGKLAKKQEEILESSKDAAESKSSSDLNRGRSPEPPVTDPNLDTASPRPPLRPHRPAPSIASPRTSSLDVLKYLNAFLT